jgi:Family of unknown function (DUF5343)
MATTEKGEQTKGPTAPYISFLTLRNVLKDMKEHSVPTRIDRTVFTNLAGGTVGQLLPAMKFLKLTDDSGVPTDMMHKLVAAVGTDTWAPELSKALRLAYAPLFKTTLEAASPGQFLETFRANYPGTEDVSRKSQTFFLNAVREAGIKISPYIMKNKKPRSAPAKKRAKNGSPKNPKGATEDNNHQENDRLSQKLPSEILLGLLNPKEMQKEQQDAIWTLIMHFKAKGQ